MSFLKSRLASRYKKYYENVSCVYQGHNKRMLNSLHSYFYTAQLTFCNRAPIRCETYFAVIAYEIHVLGLLTELYL